MCIDEELMEIQKKKNKKISQPKGTIDEWKKQTTLFYSFFYDNANFLAIKMSDFSFIFLA